MCIPTVMAPSKAAGECVGARERAALRAVPYARLRRTCA
jgi:hypothetical protein